MPALKVGVGAAVYAENAVIVGADVEKVVIVFMGNNRNGHSLNIELARGEISTKFAGTYMNLVLKDGWNEVVPLEAEGFPLARKSLVEIFKGFNKG